MAPQCVVHEVEHEDQTDGAQPTGVLEERRGDERVGGCWKLRIAGEIDVDGEMIGYKYVDKGGERVLQAPSCSSAGPVRHSA